MPFIRKHHLEDEFVFWPDLASSHYAKSVLDYLAGQGIKIVDRQDNPLNLPECRPIKHFWSILKRLVYENNWQAETIGELKARVKYCLKNIDPNVIHKAIGSIPSLLNNVCRHGVIESN